MSSPNITVDITANTDSFCASMKAATAAVKEFTDACKGLPWYVRALFALQALLARRS